MKIKKIVIENFRSYYDRKTFEIGDKLTLILGSNGDGKTTFYEALDWLFNPIRKADSHFISVKKLSELISDQSSKVSVSAYFEHDGDKCIEKSFSFSKSLSGEIVMSNYHFDMYENRGSERVYMQNAENVFNRIFDASVRSYSMIKGEDKLDIFNNQKEALDSLVKTFSDIRDFEPYEAFCERADEWAQAATENALKSNTNLKKKVGVLTATIEEKKQEIAKVNRELSIYRKQLVDSENFLENLESNKENTEILTTINNRISKLEQKKDIIKRRINEDYTIKLLDDKWILLNFESIKDEYSKKVGIYRRARKKIGDEYIKTKAKVELLEEQKEEMLANGSAPLSVFVPNESAMRDMLNDHICKVCNREAPEGSDAWNFMKHRLDMYLAKVKAKTEEKEDGPFVYNRIEELEKEQIILENNYDYLSNIYSTIEEEIAFNAARNKELRECVSDIEKENESKRQLLSSSPGLDEDSLLNLYQQIKSNFQISSDAKVEIAKLEAKLEELTKVLDENVEKYNKLAQDSPAGSYSNSAIAIHRIKLAFQEAKKRNKEEFLLKLEKESNYFLEELNKGDFRGCIKIIPCTDGSVKTLLKDTNDTIIQNPNTALKTTMYMAILFAVSKLTTVLKDNDYPLLFDAPTSSFTEKKESDFFDIISKIDKQVIIVSKSFLIPNGDDETSIINREKIDKIDAVVYRIDKQRPYDATDLSTVQTIIERIK